MTKKLLLILIPSVLLLGSCQSDQPSIIEVDQPSSIEVGQSDLILTLDDEGEKVFSFKTTDSWTVSVTDTSSVEWLSLSHLNGAKGESSIEIKAVPNNSFADRKALLTIKSGNSEFMVGVFQEFGNAVADIDIPDKGFREYCIKNFDMNKNGLVSYKEVKDIVELFFLPYYYFKEIKSLKGVEYFHSLEVIECPLMDLTEIDLSKNTKLKYLDCFGNMLTSIDLSKNTELISLSVYYNENLEKLDLSNNTKLTGLYCSKNSLKELKLEKLTKLEKLQCQNNSLSTLDLSKNTELSHISINDNTLKELDLSNNTKLTELYCSNSSLKELKLENLTELKTLNCYNNSLSTLDLTSNKRIRNVTCSGNPNLTEVWIAKDNSPIINKDSHTTVIYK